MAAVSLIWNTNMPAVTSSENTLCIFQAHVKFQSTVSDGKKNTLTRVGNSAVFQRLTEKHPYSLSLRGRLVAREFN